MSVHTIQFLAFCLFGLASLAAGYTARRRGWLHEDASRTIHFHTVVWVWSLAMLLSLWRIPPLPENLWLLLIQPVVMAATAYGVIPLAKWVGCTKPQIGVMAIGAGLSNNGFTLGAYLCYSLLSPPQEALAYGLAYVSIQVASTVLLIYPLARHYSQTHPPDQPSPNKESLARLIIGSYVNIRAMVLYAALAGVAFAVMKVPFPTIIDRWHVVTVLFYLGAFGGYFGIGLRLRLGDSKAYLKQHALLAVMKFMVAPTVAAGVLALIGFTPWPLGDVARQVVRIETVMPGGIIMVMLANLFHLDTRMASVTWMWNTLLFVAVPLPVILWLFG